VDDFLDIFDGSTITLILLLILAFIIAGKAIIITPDGNARVIERLGKRNKVLYPGIGFIIPFLDKIKKQGFSIQTYLENGERKIPLNNKKGDISLAENRMDPPTLTLIAKDNSEVFVNSVAYFRINEPMKVVYDVSHFAETFKSMVETTLRQEVGKLDGDTLISSRERLSEALRNALQEASTNWGVTIMRVEIEEITFDPEIQRKLSEAREAELIRRAEVVAAQQQADKEVIIAEGKRKAAELEAEGERKAQILRAEGAFEEAKLLAESKFLEQSREQEGIAQGYAAIVKSLASKSDAIVALEALKSQEKVAEAIGKSNNSLIIPNEAAGLFGALASFNKVWETIKK